MKRALILLAILALCIFFVRIWEVVIVIFIVIFGPIIYLLGFPFYITVKFIDILYSALIISFVSALIISIIIKYKTSMKLRFVFISALIPFLTTYFLTAKYCGENYISKSKRRES